MEEQSKHLEQLKDIRNIMEKSTKFISLSGISGVWVGGIALVGMALVFFNYQSYFSLRYAEGGVFNPEDLMATKEYAYFIQFVLLDALFMLFFAIGGAFLLSRSKAKKKGLSIWDSTAKRFLVSMLIPLVAGGIFTLALIHRGLFEFAGPATLIFYGLALFNAGRYTLDDIRYLGLFEMALGLLASFLLGYTIIFWAIGFGIMHIIYGLLMYFKYER